LWEGYGDPLVNFDVQGIYEYACLHLEPGKILAGTEWGANKANSVSMDVIENDLGLNGLD
jgi:hypothetical protein